MLSVKEVAVVYETLLSSPGMNDTVRIALSVSRKNVLLLAKVMEMGMTMKDDAKAGLLNFISQESLNDLTAISGDLLQKSGLTEMYDKLNSFQPK